MNYTEELEKAQLRIKKLIGEVAQKEEQIEQINSEWVKDVEALNKEIAALQERLDSPEQRLAEEAMRRGLNLEEFDHDTRLAELESDVEEKQKEIDKLTEQVNNLAAGATQNLTAQHEEFQKAIARYKSALEETQAALDVEVGEREVVTRERDELQDRVSAMIASNNQKVDEFNELGESNQNLQAKIKEAEENYNSLRREFFLLSGAVDGLLMVRNAQRMGDA
ncbi:hypothetical protein EC99P2_00044 [Enterococcus phage EC99P2]|nr:hypothetical protein EC99P2_00044 [Enterococcus phage EC99P2]